VSLNGNWKINHKRGWTVLKSTRLFFATAIVALLFTSCSDNIVSECEVCTDDVNTATKTTLSDIQQNIFNNSCISCHSGNPPSGGLDLSQGLAYNNLVNKPSNGSSLKRVEPFSSSASYLVKVLEASDAPQMPPGTPLSQARIDSVKSWIDRGALND
jgi:hypothetical protein